MRVKIIFGAYDADKSQEDRSWVDGLDINELSQIVIELKPEEMARFDRREFVNKTVQGALFDMGNHVTDKILSHMDRECVST